MTIRTLWVVWSGPGVLVRCTETHGLETDAQVDGQNDGQGGAESMREDPAIAVLHLFEVEKQVDHPANAVSR